jgi:hypothetical protein
VTYGTTDGFLAHFNLETITDLPGREDLKAAGLLDPRLPKDFEMPEPMQMDDLSIDEEYSVTSSILVRRNFFVPANLYFHYIEYFSFNPHDFFAKSFPFSLFKDSYYEANIPEIIGDKYIRTGSYANANFLADLYYNCGWIGFFVGFIVMSIYFGLIDLIARHKNIMIVVPIASVPVITLMNSGLIVNLIGFGLILIVFLLFLYPQLKLFK